MRRTAVEGEARLKEVDGTALNTPDWLMQSWKEAYGPVPARAIAEASLSEPALDLTVKLNPEHWAETLGGTVLPTGSVRLRQSGPVETLAGFGDGEWWVQDAAATLPARLLGDVSGLRVADICAAPGGKSVQLCVGGASVVSVDRSAERMKRLKENLKRLNLSIETVIADATEWRPYEQFDAVLVDAPCTATGTLRRHPDIALTKSSCDVTTMATLQKNILENSIRAVRPGGRLVFCTCSLQPEEGPDLITAFLDRHHNVTVSPISVDDVCGMADVVTPEGYLRTLPHQGQEWGGWDGFFAARFQVI
jgi:16S rRNA (cytosine967-C5)-methyltransferase